MVSLRFEGLGGLGLNRVYLSCIYPHCTALYSASSYADLGLSICGICNLEAHNFLEQKGHYYRE